MAGFVPSLSHPLNSLTRKQNLLVARDLRRRTACRFAPVVRPSDQPLGNELDRRSVPKEAVDGVPVERAASFASCAGGRSGAATLGLDCETHALGFFARIGDP
jgi:hypothetical protein